MNKAAAKLSFFAKMKNGLVLLLLTLVCVSIQAASKKCPGTVYFTDGNIMECVSITIPGWIDDKVQITTLSEGKKQSMKINATEIDYMELWDGKNPGTKTSLYSVPFIFTQKKGKKKSPAARWLVPVSRGKYVSFFTRYKMYKMTKKGLVGIVSTKMNNTEPEAYLWRPGEKSPVFMGQYLWFQYSNILLSAKTFAVT